MVRIVANVDIFRERERSSALTRAGFFSMLSTLDTSVLMIASTSENIEKLLPIILAFYFRLCFDITSELDFGFPALADNVDGRPPFAPLYFVRIVSAL